MDQKCVVCHDNAASFRCIQCHKPVCDECSFKTEHGAFCSRGCAATYRDYMKSKAEEEGPRRPGVVKVLLGIILLAALAAAVLWKFYPGLFEAVPGLAP